MGMLKIAIYEKTYKDAFLLEKYLKGILQNVRVDYFRNEEELLKELHKSENTYNAIFLGIDLPDVDGIRTAQMIRKFDLLVPLIYISKTDAYYKEAYDTFAYNYLLKPVTKSDVEKIMHPLKFRWEEQGEKVLHFRYSSQLNVIKLCQILYISSHLHTVTFHLVNNETRCCCGKLSDFTEQLEGSSIVRCHQSFFVNMHYISALRKDCFRLGEQMIPISRTFSKAVRESYRKYLSMNVSADLEHGGAHLL